MYYKDDFNVTFEEDVDYQNKCQKYELNEECV